MALEPAIRRADVGWALKVPLWKWLGIREEIARRDRWKRVDGRRPRAS